MERKDIDMENLQEQEPIHQFEVPAEEVELSRGQERRLCEEGVSDEDIAERIAVEALGGLKQPFLQRVQNIPLVGRTVSSISHAYESTKNSNGVLKYSAESVESLSSLISKPVLSTLEPVLRPLDRFASNQLDKVEKNFPSLRGPTSLPPLKNNTSLNRERELPSLKLHLMDYNNSIPSVEDRYSDIRLDQSPVASSSTLLATPTAAGINTNTSSVNHPKESSSRWALGRLGDDTIRALRYCLSFLKYSIENMTYQLSVLRQALVNTGNRAITAMSFPSSSSTSTPNEVAIQSPSLQSHTLALISRVKREIVETLRKVVDMLGKYSSSYLPVDARNSVRTFILSLPSRFAVVRQPASNGAIELDQNVELEAHKVIALATESASMLQNIEHVIEKSVNAAEYTLGHKTPLEPLPMFRNTFSDNVVNGNNVDDVEMS